MTNTPYISGFDLRVVPDGIKNGKLRLSLCFKPNGRKTWLPPLPSPFPIPAPVPPLPPVGERLEALQKSLTGEFEIPDSLEDLVQNTLDLLAPPRLGAPKPDNSELEEALRAFQEANPSFPSTLLEAEIKRQAKWLEMLPKHIDDQLKTLKIFVDTGTGTPVALDFKTLPRPKNKDASGSGKTRHTLWTSLFNKEFESLVRAIRFPDGLPSDSRSIRSGSVSIRSDAAASVAKLMREIKHAEVEVGLTRAAVAQDRNGALADPKARKAVISAIRNNFKGKQNAAALEQALDTPAVQNALFNAPFDKDLGAGVIAEFVQRQLIGILSTQDSADAGLRVEPSKELREALKLDGPREELALKRAEQAAHSLEQHSGQRVGTVPDAWFLQLFRAESELLKDFDTRLAKAEGDWVKRLTKANVKALAPIPALMQGPSPRPSKIAEYVKELLGTAELLFASSGFVEPEGKNSVALRDDTDSLYAVRNVIAQAALAERSQSGNPVSAEPTTNAQNEAFKRFMDLHNHPALAAFIGLVVDVEIPLGDSLPDGFISVCAKHVGILGDNDLIDEHSIWTQARLERNTDGMMGFRPASLSDVNESYATSELRNGVVNLAQITANGECRYLLETLDPRQVSETLRNRARMCESEIALGALEQDIEGALPALRTLGVSLIDSQRRVAEIDGYGAARAAAAQDAATTNIYLWAENLMIGTRLDIGQMRGGKTHWYSAFERGMGYRLDGKPPEDGVLADIETSDLSSRLKERSHGLTMPLNRFVDDPNSSETLTNDDDLVAQEILVTWQGGNGALPSRPAHLEHEDDPWFDPVQNTVTTVELQKQIGLTQFAPKPKTGMVFGQARGSSTLRFGQEIYLAMRPVYPNRGGPGLADAIDAYDDNRMGSSPKTPLTFGRTEPLLPPKVLLRNNKSEPLFKYSSLADFPGDSDQAMVLRDVHFGADSPADFAPGESYAPIGTIERYLIPPRVDFLTAEAAGGFDVVKEDFPPGLFGHDPIDRVLATGGLPIATGKSEKTYPDAPKDQRSKNTDALHIAEETITRNKDAQHIAEETITRNKEGRGEVLGHVIFQKDQSPHKTLQEHYYPDPMVGKCVLMLVRGGRPLLDAPIVLDFYRQKKDRKDKAPNRHWPNALPVLVRLLSAEAPDIALDEDEERGAVTKSVAGDNGIQVELLSVRRFKAMSTFPTIEIRLPQGQECELHAWSLHPTDVTLGRKGLAEHGLIQHLFGEGVLDRLQETLRNRLDNVQTIAPLSGVTPALVVKLRNATQKPITVPKFTTDKMPLVMKDFAAEIQEHTKTGITDPAKALAVAWRNWSANNPVPANWDNSNDRHDLRATTAFFAGDIGLDRRSSSNMFLQAKWDEYRDDPAQPLSREADTMRSFKPLSGGWRNLAATHHPVPLDETTIADDVLLHRDDDELERCSYHDFGDTSHRRVHLRPAATSRFDPFIRNHSGDADFHVSPERNDDLPNGIVVHIPATERPPKPVFEQDPLPVFDYKRGTYQSAGSEPFYGVIERRHARTRLFIKRPWFTRGEGQKLALLLYDQTLLGEDSKPLKPDAWLDTAPEGLHSMISMRARDPEVASGSIPNFIAPQDLLNDVVDERRGRLPLFHHGAVDTKPLGYLSAASFDVFPDLQRDIWLCDIDISTHGTYMPFLFMRLAAIQPNSIPRQELSQPVQQMAQIPPDRNLGVLLSHENPGTLRITLDGDKYWRREPGPFLAEFKGLVDRPWVSTIFQKRRRNSDDAWRIMENTAEDSRQAGQSPLEKSPHLFDFQLDLPEEILKAGDDRNFEYAVEISEFEMVAADAGIGRAEDNGLDIVDIIQVSPSGLSAIIRGKTTYAAQVTFDELNEAKRDD